jgi:uncharacterized protein (DUF2267 family)
MVSFLTSLTQKTGVRTDKAIKGLEVLFKALHSRISNESFFSITARIPEIRDLPSLSANNYRDQLDFWNSNLSVPNSSEAQLSKSPLTEILTQLSRAGFTRREAQKFLPVTFQLLKKHLPADLIGQVDRSIPGLSNLSATSSSGLLDRLKNLV